MRILGLDIGGANLKAAHSDGTAKTVPFELWKTPEKLNRELRKLAKSFPKYDCVGITMTGESCDCYMTKREGVNAILDQVLKVFPEEMIRVWMVDEGFQSVVRAREMYLRTASSNWHVLASYCGRLQPKGLSLLIDIGSTTTDIIPIVDGVPASIGKTDAERLDSEELIYIGVGRTPTAMICVYNACRETFATTIDIHLIKRQIPEEPDNCSTADGRPATKVHAAARIARMLGGDCETVTPKSILEYVDLIYTVQSKSIENGLHFVLKRQKRKLRRIFFSGAGVFLGGEVCSKFFGDPLAVKIEPRFLADIVGEECSKSACAWALTQMME